MPDVHVLGKFIQLVYLNFYQGVKKKMGNTGIKILLEKINQISHLVPLLPNFEKNETKPLDRIAHVFLPMPMSERKKVIRSLLKPIYDTLRTLEGFAGKKAIQKVYEGLYLALLCDYPLLAKRYTLEQIFKELENAVSK